MANTGRLGGSIPAARVGYDMRVMARRLVSVLTTSLVAGLAGTGATADTVRLANGNRYENVVAEVAADSVTIRFSYGDLVLPRSLVAGVDKADSSLEVYLAAAARLAADPAVTAGAWLDLATTARAAGLEDGYRRALLRAAELDPGWPGLAERLQALDYVWEAERRRWVPFADSRAERAATERRQAQAAVARRAARDDERQRLVETLELLALARLAAQLDEGAAAERLPVAGIPLVTFVGTHHGPGWGWLPTERNRQTMRELERRQPGSLLPVGPPPRQVRAAIERVDESGE